MTELAAFPPTSDPPLPVTAWRIHLGAHKTATTHLQETLAALRPRLAARGADYIPLGALRASGFARALYTGGPVMKLPGLRRVAARRRARDILGPLRVGPGTLILSEEKLLGSSRHIFSDPAYPLIEKVVPLLAGLGEGEGGVTFFLSIRSFDTQLASAYAQELRVLPPPPGGFEALRARALARPPRWTDLVLRIRRAAPGVPIRIWRQEDYRRNRGAILAALCGRDPGPLPEIAVPVSTKSPTAAGVRAAEALPRDLPPAERRARVAEIYAAHQDDGCPFRPFAPEETERLRKAYAADLADLARLDPGMMVACSAVAAAA